MYFRSVYKPIPVDYNLVLAMLWRHPENVQIEKVKVVHYCAAVSVLINCVMVNGNGIYIYIYICDRSVDYELM
jgi:hypothetical protein